MGKVKIRYESLRNIAMHFKEFKSVKNAFYSSAVVTRASQAPIFSGACFSRARLKIQAFLFFFLSGTLFVGHAFLAKTVETGDKNRDDFHCMQMSLVISMRFISG